MEKYCATSDVKCTVGDNQTPPSAGLTSNALPEVRKPIKPTDSQTGVSTNNVQSKTSVNTNKDTKDTPHWYALRTTYGREKKAYNYLLSKGVEAFYPILKSVKLVDSKRITIEESRIPNIFFAYGTEDELKYFVYDNVNLPYLRFYYRHTHVGNKIVKVPLVVPDSKRIRDAAFFLIIMLVTFAATLLNPQKYVSSRTIQKCVEHVSTST